MPSSERSRRRADDSFRLLSYGRPKRIAMARQPRRAPRPDAVPARVIRGSHRGPLRNRRHKRARRITEVMHPPAPPPSPSVSLPRNSATAEGGDGWCKT